MEDEIHINYYEYTSCKDLYTDNYREGQKLFEIHTETRRLFSVEYRIP